MHPMHAYYRYTTARAEEEYHENLSGYVLCSLGHGDESLAYDPRRGMVYIHSPYVVSPVGPPGIEPGLYAPEAHVLPVYYGPTGDITRLCAL